MRYAVGFVLLLLALGTLRLVGCGDAERPCEVIEDCGAVVKVPVSGVYVSVLADDPCTRVSCRYRVCQFSPLDCHGDYVTGNGCASVEFTECDPDAQRPCGNITPISEGEACDPNCTGTVCVEGRCVCTGWCICGLNDISNGCSASAPRTPR
jgi:hypothetical protein